MTLCLNAAGPLGSTKHFRVFQLIVLVLQPATLQFFFFSLVSLL